MTCDFTSISTVFQSNQDDVWMITKGLCNGPPFKFEKISFHPGIELCPLDQ